MERADGAPTNVTGGGPTARKDAPPTQETNTDRSSPTASTTSRRATVRGGRQFHRYPAKLLHDFRRTAVRNLERAGVARSSAMKMVGHATESIYRRYAIQDETMLREASAKLEAWTDDQALAAKTTKAKGAVADSRKRRADEDESKNS